MPLIGAFSRYGIGYVAPLAGGDDGTAQTIRAMRALIDDAWKNSEINRCAIDICRAAGADQWDDAQKAHAIYSWVLSNFYFVNDPWTKQAVRPAIEALKLCAGNCATINGVVLPSLLGSIGIPTRFITIAADPRDPNAFSHIYIEADLDGQWTPLDAARAGTSFGVAPPHFFKRWGWSVTHDDCGEYPGKGQLNGARFSYMGGCPGTDRPMIGLAGLDPSTVSVIDSIAGSAGQIASAVSGQPVVNVINPAIGPGGTQLYSQGNPYPYYAQSWFDQPSYFPEVSNGEFLIFGAVGFFALRALMSKGRR